MVLDINKEQIILNKLICEKKEEIIVQGDVIVPDSKPDILNTVDTSSIVSIYKKEVNDGKVRIDGNINVYIMYMPESGEDRIRGINTNLDFSENFIIPDCNSSMEAITNIVVKSIECKVLNGRKINIQVCLETTVKVYDNSEISIISNVNNENIQMLRPSYNLNSLIGCGKNTTSVKENIKTEIDSNFGEILKVRMNIEDKDVKISYNKVLVKADANVQIMYLTEEGHVNVVSSRLPIVSFIDIPNVNDNNICDTFFEIKNIVIKPNSADEHSICVEIEAEVTCYCYENRSIEIVEDLYSTCSKIDYKKTKINAMSNKCSRSEKLEIRENINAPELMNNKIINIDALPVVSNETKTNGEVRYEGNVNIDIAYSENDDVGMYNKKMTIPFDFTVSDSNINDDITIDTNVELKNKDFIIKDGGDIGANIDLLFDVNMFQNRGIDVIADITDEENEDIQDYSVVIYRVQKGDTLWKIAKKFKSTIDDIARINGIENPDKIDEGEKLYIPKKVRVNAI